MDGILIVDKPQGLTSHDIVEFIRRRFRIKKVGHAGTLDPIATGVLVILLGKATKLFNLLTSQQKEYEVVMTLGKRTDTGDADGRVIFENPDVSHITHKALEDVIKEFRGRIRQVPPMTSAIKLKGKKLYELARKGVVVERASREIFIDKLEIIDFSPPDVSLLICCSKGTYVRTLCDDIGGRLGCGGYVSRIRRIRSGDFKIEDAISFSQLRELPVEKLVGYIRTGLL